MFERILLPLDGSRLGEGIIPYVGQIARGFGARVTVLYVASPEASARPTITRVPDGKVVPVPAYLDEMEGPLAEAGVATADSDMVTGAPAAEIVRYAEGKGYNLIAMATHGRSGPGRWVYGSTTDKVLHSTRLAMLLLRPPTGPAPAPERLPVHTAIVPLDGSELAEAVLPTVVQVAARLDLKVALVRVVPTAAMGYGGFEPYAYDPKIDEQIGAAADDYLRQKSDELKGQRVHVGWHRLRGYPATQIIELAERTGAGMIVMSTHGRSGVGRWVLGSVADRVLRSSHHPVLLMRSKGSA